jgi:predicted regulator of Ras-like GTPase activity (Roadblock/LC7/MglB family)
MGVLKDLRGTNGVVASTVISRDGIPLASDLPKGVNPDIFALRTAFMQGIGELMTESVDSERARTVVVVADQHYIVTTSVDDHAILVVVVDRSVEIGGLLPQVWDTATAIKSSMG